MGWGGIRLGFYLVFLLRHFVLFFGFDSSFRVEYDFLLDLFLHFSREKEGMFTPVPWRRGDHRIQYTLPPVDANRDSAYTIWLASIVLHFSRKKKKKNSILEFISREIRAYNSMPLPIYITKNSFWISISISQMSMSFPKPSKHKLRIAGWEQISLLPSFTAKSSNDK